MTEQPKGYFKVPEDTVYLLLGILRLEKDGIKNPASNIDTALKELKDCCQPRPVSTPPEGAAPEPDYSRHNPRIELRKVCEQEAHDAAIRQDEREKVLTQFADLIHNESVRLSPAMVDMVYSYRVAQIITTYRNSKQEREP